MAKETTQTSTVGTGAEGSGESGGSTDPNEAGNGASTQNGSAGVGGSGGGTTDDSKNDISSLPDWAQGYVKELRDEAAANRVKAKEKADKAAEDARKEAMSDVDKAVEEAVNKTREELTLGFTTRLVEGAVQTALTSAGVEDTTAVLKALRGDDGTIPGIEVDGDGNIKGINKTVDDFLKKYPGFITAEGKTPPPRSRRETGNPGDRGGSSGRKDANAAIREAFNRGRGK